MAFFAFRFRDGDTIDVLADALDDLRRTLYGVRAINFTGDSRDIVEYVANLFGSSKIRKYHFLFLFENSKLSLLVFHQQQNKIT